MGLFGGRISRITATHAEKISDKDIVSKIMSPEAAEKNFSEEQYNAFMDLFDQIAARKTAFYSDAERYFDRAFSIAYQFENHGFPYEYCHGTASNEYAMYTAKKPVFEEAVADTIDKFKAIIDNIIRDNDLNEADAMFCSGWFFSTSLVAFKSLGNMICETDYLPFFFQTLNEVYLSKVVGPYIQDGSDEEKIADYQDRIQNCFAESYDSNDSLEGVIIDYTKGFMSIIGAPDDKASFGALVATLGEWAVMTQEYTNAYDE